jgi:hypothetical protein
LICDGNYHQLMIKFGLVSSFSCEKTQCSSETPSSKLCLFSKLTSINACVWSVKVFKEIFFSCKHEGSASVWGIRDFMWKHERNINLVWKLQRVFEHESVKDSKVFMKVWRIQKCSWKLEGIVKVFDYHSKRSGIVMKRLVWRVLGKLVSSNDVKM